MRTKQLLTRAMLALAAGAAAGQAGAALAVVDVAAVNNLVKQVHYWQQQLSAMQAQFQQIQQSRQTLDQTYSAMTGARNTGQLLPTSINERNYLPADYQQAMQVLNGNQAGYGGLATQAQSILQANQVLNANQMNSLSPQMRLQVEQGRQASSTLSAMTQLAYQSTSQRFGALQTLIGGIATAQDPKAIQDLQARIQAEQLMLTNEQSKLQSLQGVQASNEALARQRVTEQVIQGHGKFSTRFTPKP